MPHWCLLLLVFLLVPETSFAQETSDLYAVLGLKRGVKDRELKSVFRKLSRKYHPDLNKDEDAKDKFVQLQRAYEVLGDKKKRRIYDQFGLEAVEKVEQGKQAGAGGSLHDVFASFFGGGGPSTGQFDKRGPDTHLVWHVTLEDLYNGREVELRTRKRDVCTCSKPCPKCGGHGVTVTRRQVMPGFVQNVQTQCRKCRGHGKINKPNCDECKGRGGTEEDTLSIVVERGQEDGHTVTFEYEGDTQLDVLPGHVLVEMRTLPHDSFRREGDDLHSNVTVSLLEALTGFETTLLHLDGRRVPFKRRQVTRPGQVIRVRGEGMPKHEVPSERGDLFLHVRVEFPSSLTEEQRAHLRDIEL